MEISVDFEDGRIREYNLSSFVTDDALRGADARDVRAPCVLTEFDLRLDLLEQEGLRLDLYTNTFSSQRSQKRTVNLQEGLRDEDGEERGQVWAQAATRHVAGSVYLITRRELESATYILVRRCGSIVAAAWRQGSQGWLVNGQRFSRLAREIYTDNQIASNNAKLIQMMRYLVRANPGVGEREVVEMTGFPYDAYQEALAMEEGQMPEEVGGAGDSLGFDDEDEFGE